jgi:ABC transport system ATP-binding/permease protein
MWKLTIEDDEGKQTGLPLAHEEYALGRAEANSIRLTDRNVSRQHATLSKNAQGWVIRDLDSYNGTYVNGVRVNGEQHLRHGDLVQLGDYRIELVDEALTSAITCPAPMPGRPTAQTPLHTRPNRLVMVVGPTPGAEFPLDGERFSIGRSEDATISINHSSVSRLHAELISLGNGRYEVVDKQSANGVRINGVELKRGLLEAGDALELGDVRLRFVGAGKIFRAGPDNSSQATGPSSYESVAPSVRAPPRSSNALTSTPGKMIGLLLAVGLLVIAVLFAITRAGPHEAPQPPQPLPATSQEAESEARILQEAQERFQQKNLEGAHNKLKELAENAAARESPEFKQIEEAWANDMFHRAETASKPSDKVKLLNEIVAMGGSVSPAQRARVAEELERIKRESPMERSPDQDGPLPNVTPGTYSPPAHSQLGSPSTAKSGDPAAPQSAAFDASSYPEKRKRLEPKVWSGKASIDEIKLLKAICNHMGDDSCRARAQAMLPKSP